MRPAALTNLALALLASIASGFSSLPKPFLPRHAGTSSPLMRTTTAAAAATTTTTTTSVLRRTGPPSAPSFALSGRRASAAAVPSVRGGAGGASPTEASAGSRYAAEQSGGEDGSGSKCPVSFLASVWGAGGVAYILLQSARRILPVALEPFAAGGSAAAAAGAAAGSAVAPLTAFQLAAYIATCVLFAYVKGYKGLQTKFSPLVVSRARTLIVGKSSYVHILLAPLYSMGLFYATKKRMAVSWGITLGVAVIVAAVKRLPYPWRNIVNAGVVVGLTWGTISIPLEFMKAKASGKSPADPALPARKVD